MYSFENYLCLLRRYLVVYCLLIANSAWAADEKALEIVMKTSAYYQELENFCATYDLTIYYPEEEDKGAVAKMTITAQGQQYRLCYDQKETVTDGETVWMYDRECNEVTISAYDKTDNLINFAELHNLYQQGYSVTYNGYRVIDSMKQIVRELVQLTPVEEEDCIFIRKVILEIDPATSQIHGWEIIQNNGPKYTCTICSFEKNLPLPENYFTFDLDAYGDDLAVMDLREQPDMEEGH